MKYLIPLLAFLLIGCDGEKSNEPTNPKLEYKIEGDTVTITGCSYLEVEDLSNVVMNIGVGGMGDFVIPTKIEGKTVTSIGFNAFSKQFHVKIFTIPDGVTSIGKQAFYGNVFFNFTIPDGVTTIGDSAFGDCPNMWSITIPDSVTSIGRYAFGDNMKTITFLGDAPKIHANAFGASSLTIYRDADAKGWGDTFRGRPVKIFNEKLPTTMDSLTAP